MVKWKMPERRSEEEESEAADSKLLQHRWLCCSGFHKQGGGVMDVWKCNEQPGRKSQMQNISVNSE